MTGWDIGGVNTKVALAANGRVVASLVHPYEMQRAPDTLVPLLRDLAARIGFDQGQRPSQTGPHAHAVTMTAELSQMFRSKREGVRFVLDAAEEALAPTPIHVYTTEGRFLLPAEARSAPLVVAAANWMATATMVARGYPDSLLIDIGTTTTDIIPIAAGCVVALGRTDPQRLASGELVYTGALRTPVEAMASEVPIDGSPTGVSAEGFALAGDVHLWRGQLNPADYTCPTPDGRPATREFAGERLARVVCADRDLLDAAAISVIADSLACAQIERVKGAVRRVHSRHPSIRTAVVTGLGAFLGLAAAREAGLDVQSLSSDLGEAASRCAPAAAIALLLDAALTRD